MQKVASHKQ